VAVDSGRVRSSNFPLVAGIVVVGAAGARWLVELLARRGSAEMDSKGVPVPGGTCAGSNWSLVSDLAANSFAPRHLCLFDVSSRSLRHRHGSRQNEQTDYN